MSDDHLMTLVGYNVQSTAEWRRRKAEEFPEDARNLKAAENLEQLAAEIEQLEGSEIYQQIRDVQERLNKVGCDDDGDIDLSGRTSSRPSPRNFAQSGSTSATIRDCNFSNGTANCWRRSFKRLSMKLFPSRTLMSR